MKKYKKWLVVFCMLSFIEHTYSQKQSSEEYYGRWQWLSGKNDTLIIIIKPVGQYLNKTTEANKLAQNISNIVGFHQYIENGLEVQSSLQVSLEDTISGHSSISAIFADSKDRIIIALHDLVIDRYLTGYFKILPEIAIGKVFALLDLNFPFEGPPPPKGRSLLRSIPNRIVLEKIK